MGAIAYVSRREVVDVMGLVTPAIIAYRQNGEPGVLRYLERNCPDYLVIFPAWFPVLAAMTDRFRPIYRITLAHNTVAGGGRDGRLQDAVDIGPLPMMVARGEARIMPVMKRLVVVAAVIATVALGDAPGGPSGAEAQVFRWIDGEGIIHYSQGIESVPPRFRGAAVIIGYERTAAPAPVVETAPAGIGRVQFTPGQPIMVSRPDQRRDARRR